MNHHALRLTPSNSPFYKSSTTTTSPGSPTKPPPRPDEPGLQLRAGTGRHMPGPASLPPRPANRSCCGSASTNCAPRVPPGKTIPSSQRGRSCGSLMVFRRLSHRMPVHRRKHGSSLLPHLGQRRPAEQPCSWLVPPRWTGVPRPCLRMTRGFGPHWRRPPGSLRS